MSASVLIVDDSLTVRMDLAEAFAAAGFRALPCARASEARDALAREAIDLMVLDVGLPDADGVEFLKEIRASPRGASLAVLMLSSEAEIRDRIRGLRTGAEEYVGKPYDITYVISRAQQLVGARAAQRDERTAVLIIDDSATFREELREVCEASGYRVLTAESGEDGLRVVAVERPVAVIVDGVLPGIDGATVIRRIRLDAASRATLCLLLTASDDGGAELRALDAGADDFARKEGDAGVILAKLAAALRRTPLGADPRDTSSLLGAKKILAVDDSATYLHELADALRGEGFDAVLARSGEEALELLAVQHVDCILLDLVMPGMNGRETCRKIKSDPLLRDVPLILMTAIEDRAVMVQGLGDGADDFISKASDFEVLRARVRTQIRRRQFEDEHRRIREQLLRKELEAAEARAAHELADTRATLIGELERKNQELEAFSYSVSHDLRAPLRAIDGFSQALLEDCEAQLDERGRAHLRRVRAAAQRMNELIEDLLQLSRVGRAELRCESLDLSALARSVVAQLKGSDAARSATFDVRDGLVVEADARLLRIVLENLLGNAWKFVAKTQHARIELGALEHDGDAAYFVRDNGAGFDMRHAGRLFQPFQRLHDNATFPGTGVGLATVRRIVERHGGYVWAEGSVGGGATFYFVLHASRSERARASPAVALGAQ